MEPSNGSLRPAAIATAVGGALLAVGSVLTWATASVDANKIAQAVGIPPSAIPPGVLENTSKSFAGTSFSEGKVALACGILVLLAGIGLAISLGSRRLLAIIALVGGAVGGLFALYDATIARNNAVNDIERQFSATGLPGNAHDFFSVSLGIGIWLCLLGAIVAVVAAAMALMNKDDAISATAAGSGVAVPGGGFLTPSPTSPTMPVSSTMPAAPMPNPVAPEPASPTEPLQPIAPPADPAPAPPEPPSEPPA